MTRYFDQVRRNGVDILNRCIDNTFENGLFATDKPLDEKFVEHLWTNKFTIDGNKISHEYFISSERSGIVHLNMCVIGADGQKSEALTLATFHFRYLSVNTLASAISVIVERT